MDAAIASSEVVMVRDNKRAMPVMTDLRCGKEPECMK